MSFGGGQDVSYSGPSVAATDNLTKFREGVTSRVNDFTNAILGKKAAPTTSLISSAPAASPAMQDTPGRHKSLLGQ